MLTVFGDSVSSTELSLLSPALLRLGYPLPSCQVGSTIVLLWAGVSSSRWLLPAQLDPTHASVANGLQRESARPLVSI